MYYPTGTRFDKQIRFIYKWLPVFCGCHRRPERSFFVNEYQMPVCARCQGELIGILAGLIAVWFIRLPYRLMAVLMLPMIADGLIQGFTDYESTNRRRLSTGILFGFGITMIIMMFWITVFRYGLYFGAGIRS